MRAASRSHTDKWMLSRAVAGKYVLTPHGLMVVTNNLSAPGKNAVTVLDTRTWQVEKKFSLIDQFAMSTGVPGRDFR